MLRRSLMLATTAAALALGSTAAQAQVEIQWWHAMTGANNDVIEKLAKDFNDSQKDIEVKTEQIGFDPYSTKTIIGAQAGKPQVADVMTVEQDAALDRVMEPRQQADQRRFAASR